MNRRKFTFAALLGFVGMKATAQEPTYTVRTDKWDGPYDNGEGGCYLTNHSVIGFKRVVCHEGEEYCPLGHSQKAELGPVFGTEADENHFAVSKAFTHTCAVCGIVYVPRKTP